MPNLLANPALWKDANNVSPPACWDGTKYNVGDVDQVLTFIGSNGNAGIGAGDWIACSIDFAAIPLGQAADVFVNGITNPVTLTTGQIADFSLNSNSVSPALCAVYLITGSSTDSDENNNHSIHVPVGYVRSLTPTPYADPLNLSGLINPIAEARVWRRRTPPVGEWSGTEWAFNTSNFGSSQLMTYEGPFPSPAFSISVKSLNADPNPANWGNIGISVSVDGVASVYRPVVNGDALTVDIPAANASLLIGMPHLAATQSISIAPAPPPVPTDDANCTCDPTGDENPSPTLKALRDELATRMGYGGQVATGALSPGIVAKFNSNLSTAQQYLYRRYRVLRTERFFTWSLTAGQRFVDINANLEQCPVELDPRSVTWAGIQYQGMWYPLTDGIPPELYTLLQNRFPRRYEIRECIEIWPPPSDDTFKLRIKGHYAPLALSADTDKCTLDDRLVFLQALSDAKADAGHADFKRYSDEAEIMIRGMTAGSHGTRRYIPGNQRFLERLPTTWVRQDGTVITD